MVDPAKPTVDELGIDVATVPWQRAGGGTGEVQVAFVEEWVLVRAGSAGQVLVFDHGEWDAFLRGAKDDEFDDAGAPDGV